MSTKTTNYQFIKPALTDPADITTMNENWDKLDQKLRDLSELSDIAISETEPTDSDLWIDLNDETENVVPPHTHDVTDIAEGTFTGKMVANASAVASITVKQVRNIYAGTSDLTAGTSALPTGDIYLVYE